MAFLYDYKLYSTYYNIYDIYAYSTYYTYIVCAIFAKLNYTYILPKLKVMSPVLFCNGRLKHALIRAKSSSD